ncbi:MAG: hypothetical protein Tsb0033_14840 [Winogradskyella sp.]
MKQLILFFVIGLTIQFSFTQAPTNDTVGTATELTSLNYSESDIRLDLADVNNASPNGCNTNGFTAVFYKFTATENTFVNASISSGSTGGSIVNSFVITYTAPNLNATSMSELSHLAESACVFGTQTSFQIVAGQSYYIMVHRSDANAQTNFSFSEVSDVPQSEREALVDLYNSTNGANWTNNTNWTSSSPVSTWFGVTTTNIAGTEHVTQINLSQNNLTGTLPISIGNLTSLNWLQLNTNNISGTIPATIANLQELNLLLLAVNNLSGGIPSVLGTMSSLTYLHLGDNPLGGSIPIEIFNLTNLNYLDFRACNLTGAIPPEIGNLTNLTQLFLFFNDLTGSIPNDFGNLINLNNVSLNGNNLEGSLPSNISNFTNLQFLNLADNNFSGTIPDMTSLPLSQLWIQNNNFTFEDFENQFISYQNVNDFQYVPQANITEDDITIVEVGDDVVISTNLTSPNNQYLWFFNGAQLVNETGPSITLNNIQSEQMGTYFCYVTNSVVTGLTLLTGNFIVGQDPTLSPDYAILQDLYNATGGASWFNNDNWLDASIPLSGWHGITVANNNVTRISLSNNNLTGSLPNSLANLSGTQSIFLNNNQLSGIIPNFSTIPTLESLRISNNNFSFLDFEPNFTANSTLTNFFFTPQNQLDDEIILDAILGDDYTFNMTTIAGSNVEYQWHTLSTFDQSVTAVNGQNTNQLNLPNIQENQLDAYTCIATSPLIPGLEIRRNMIELKGPVSQIERDALIAFYNATDGPNWTNAQNWNTAAPVSTWQGVTTTGNKVTRLALQSFNPNGDFPDAIGDLTNLEGLYIGLGDLNLTGSIPETIGNLTNLKVLWFQATGMSGEIPESFGNLVNLREIRFLGNNFTGTLPASMSNLTQLESVLMSGNEFFGNGSSFSGPIPFNTPNANIDLSNNNFDFGDLEPFVTNGNYLSFNYSPQNNDDDEESITSAVGSTVTLNVNDIALSRNNNALNNNYQWFKDNVQITGANSPSYVINNAQTSDNGEYYCEITNAILPDLTIIRAPITLFIDPSLSIDDTEKKELSVYPNPADNWLNIKTHNLSEVNLFIYDLNGRLVIQQILNSNKNALNIEALQKGVYILKLKDETSTYTKRFIKN